jgi:hypothetical protein
VLKVDPHTVLNWAKAGIIPEAFRAGRTVRFSRDAVNASLDLNNAGEGRYLEMTSLALKCMLGIDYARMPNMRRHHLCAHALGARLPVRRDGLAHAQGARLAVWFGLYNDWRPHQNLGNLTPSQVYRTLRLAPETPSPASRAADGFGSDELPKSPFSPNPPPPGTP